ncbi:hypothetical protein A0H81_02677 [Grifola frondosa]|uniref:Uncharacterized protein n=1 Tax=Grifola frondosa TaxID=5627 RepID=A0A1C7MPD4_GRIFR|nr:hypothetical protein A0H81_02677 [Grifola frondosa]
MDPSPLPFYPLSILRSSLVPSSFTNLFPFILQETDLRRRTFASILRRRTLDGRRHRHRWDMSPPGPVPATNTPRHKTRFDHPASPPVPLSGRGVQRDDSSYSSGDTVPQRRGREFEEADAEIDAKRRRVDDRMNESAVARRAPTETIAPCLSLPDRPVSIPFDSPASQVDQSRTRKRLPLPPQSMRFLEASRNPSALPINAGQGSSSLPLPSQAVASTTQPQRFTNPVNDMPSGPRRQAPPGREDEIDRTTRVPPTKPASGRIRTRFDNPAPVPIVPQDVPVPTERDAMDVDHPPSSRMSHLQINEGLPRSSHGMYADRPGMVSPADAVPRGPRAMTRGSMPPQELQSASSRVKPKAPAQGPGGEGWGERRDREDSFSKYPRGPAAGPDMPGRRFDGPPDRQDTRMHPIADSKQQVLNTRDIRDLPSRPSRRSNDIPLAPARVSGTNSVPIGNKKGYVTDAEGESLRSPIDRYRPMDKSFEEPVRGPMLPAHNDMRDDYDRRISGYAPGPVVDRHRPHQVDAEMPERRGAVSSIGRTDSFVSERSESSATYQPSGLPSRPRKDYTAGERRKSRFDPEPAPLPPSSEPRIWMTREQSENLARVNQAESNARPHESAWQQLPPPNFGSGSNEPSLPPRWNNDSASGPYDGNTRVGAVDVAPRRRRAQDSQDRGRDHGATVDPYPRGPPSGLEGRLTSNHDTHYVEAPSRGEPRPRSPSPRSRRDIYPDPPRHEYRDMREYPPVVRGEPENWDRPASQETFKDPSPSLAKLHPDRARIIGPVAAPSPSEADASVRTSKPVRIRRPGPMSAKSSQEGLVPAAAGRDAVSERTGREEERHPPMSEPLRPGIKRGGSLLERLDLERSSPGLPDIPPPSLRERVEDPKRSNEDIGDVMVDGRRRRVLKPRRGRRGGAP